MKKINKAKEVRLWRGYFIKHEVFNQTDNRGGYYVYMNQRLIHPFSFQTQALARIFIDKLIPEVEAEENPLIYCECGCTGSLLLYDLKGNERHYIAGHENGAPGLKVIRPGMEFMNKIYDKQYPQQNKKSYSNKQFNQ